jgi:hypothetical protein
MVGCPSKSFMGRKRRERRRPAKNLAESALANPAADPGTGPGGDAIPAAEASADRLPSKVGSGRGISALARTLQVEDLILFAWIVLVSRIVERLLGEHLHAVATLGAAPRWVYAVVFGGLAVVFYTRGPADVDLNEATSRRCVLGLLGWVVARSYFGGDGQWLAKAIGVAFLVVLLTAPLNSLERLPRTSLGLRRTLVLPATLVGNSVFSGMITPDFFRGSELHGVAPEHRLFASLVLSVFLFLYVVVAPRVMAGGEWRPLSWVVRLGVYLTALWMGRPPWLDFAW